MRVGLMGATGMVGTEMLRILEERRFPGERAPCVRVAALRRSQARVRRWRGDVRGAAARLLRRSRPRDRRRRRAALDRMVAAGGRRGREGHRQVVGVPHGSRRTARRRRGEPRRHARHAEGHRVVPELHDDDSGHRARAAASRGAHRPDGRLDVPIGVGCGPDRTARARRAVDEARRSLGGAAARGRATGLPRAGRGLGQADRGQRDPARRFGEGTGLHVGGMEDGARVAQDPPRRRRSDAPSRVCACPCTSVTP